MSDQAARDLPANIPRQPRLLSPGQFSIASLLLLTLWISLCLAAFRLSPVVGVTLGLWTVPAAVRSLYSVQYWKRRLPTVSWGQVYEIFGHSLILVAAAYVLAMVAFGIGSVGCAIVGAGVGLPWELTALAAAVTGLASGSTAGFWILWAGRPSKFKRPT